jgi:hypothetical protein
MQLSLTSWHARLYKWVYKNELPSNLCPYFWKVILGIISVIPFTLLSLPALIISKDSRKDNNIFWNGFIGAVLYFILFLLFVTISPILYLFGVPISDNMFFSGITIIAFLLILLVAKIIDRIRSRSKQKSPNIFKEYIKAKYNKYCPKIDWKK